MCLLFKVLPLQRKLRTTFEQFPSKLPAINTVPPNMESIFSPFLERWMNETKQRFEIWIKQVINMETVYFEILPLPSSRILQWQPMQGKEYTKSASDLIAMISEVTDPFIYLQADFTESPFPQFVTKVRLYTSLHLK